MNSTCSMSNSFLAREFVNQIVKTKVILICHGNNIDIDIDITKSKIKILQYETMHQYETTYKYETGGIIREVSDCGRIKVIDSLIVPKVNDAAKSRCRRKYNCIISQSR